MAAVLGIGLIAVVGPAEAATWTPTYNVSAAGWSGNEPLVAVDRQGDSLMVWMGTYNNSPYHQVQLRIKPAGGSMGSIKTLSATGLVSAWPQVASDDDGDSAVVWEQEGRIVGRRVSATGAVGPLRTLSPGRAMSASVAVEPSGRALVLWTAIDGGKQTTGRYFGKDGSLGPVLLLSGGELDPPGLAMDRTGTAVAAWSVLDRVVARRIRPGYVSPLKVIAPPTPGVTYGRVNVGVDRDGDATITYHRHRAWENSRLQARLWGRTNSLGGVLTLSPSTDNLTFYSEVATDLEGDSVVVWSRHTTGLLTDVSGRRISRTGTLGALTRLGAGELPAVTVDDDGDGLVVWYSPGPLWLANQVYARTISRAGVFATAQKLSSDARVVRADSSPGGRYTVIWQQHAYPYQIRTRFGQ